MAVGLNIYVFGGLNSEVIYSCMNVLNTETLQWSEVSIQGEWPSPRHSHSMIANGPLIFMFGGFNGKKALGDLYTFDIRTSIWKKEKTSGRAPFPRFSHCMFIYKNYLGILGGCPLRQQNQELSLLNLQNNAWMHVTVNSMGRDLWVRSSTCVIDDDLVIIGGGTSCYAFGTKFSQPMKMNLKMLDFLYGMSSVQENKLPDQLQNNNVNISRCRMHVQDISASAGSDFGFDTPDSGDGHCMDAQFFVLRVEKKYAKLAKDILKKFGWLDLSRKVQPSQDDHHIRLPISRSFFSFYQKEHLDSIGTFNDFCRGLSGKKGLSLAEVSLPTALRFLSLCGSLLQSNDVPCNRKISKAPQNIMKESVCTLLRKKGLMPKLLEQLPMRFVVYILIYISMHCQDMESTLFFLCYKFNVAQYVYFPFCIVNLAPQAKHHIRCSDFASYTFCKLHF